MLLFFSVNATAIYCSYSLLTHLRSEDVVDRVDEDECREGGERHQERRAAPHEELRRLEVLQVQLQGLRTACITENLNMLPGVGTCFLTETFRRKFADPNFDSRKLFG